MIKEIEIKNFRGVKESNLLKLAPLTVFTGSEGSGKSTVGHFLTMLKQTVTTADSNVVLYPGDSDSLVKLGTQSSLRYKGGAAPLEFSYRFELPQYLLFEDPERDKFDVPTQFLFGENVRFHCILNNTDARNPTVQQFTYELCDKERRVLSASTKRSVVKTKKSERVQFAVETDGYELKNRTGRPWLQNPPGHFYGFSNELNTYYKNAQGLFDLNTAHEQTLQNIYYVGSNRTRFNALHLWSGLRRFDVGHNGMHTITALLGASTREISLGDRRKNQPVSEIITEALQRMKLVHDFQIEDLEAIEDGYAAKVTVRKSKHEVELTEAGNAIVQVLPILVQCFCTPSNSTIVLDGIETHLSIEAQALLADILLDVIHSKENREDRNIQLIISTQSEALLRRLQRRVAEGSVAQNAIATYYTKNYSRGVDFKLIPLLEAETLHDISQYFTFKDDDRVVEITVSKDLPTLSERELEKPVPPEPKEPIKKGRGPGRPKGSKNKPKTDEPDKPKRGPGRPKGSKNKKKKQEAPAQPKRGRGRPKGSKNKPKGEEAKTPKRGPGRPKGSKNKPKIDNADKPKRGRGRPKGSKNKNTKPAVVRTVADAKASTAAKPNAKGERLKQRHSDKLS